MKSEKTSQRLSVKEAVGMSRLVRKGALAFSLAGMLSLSACGDTAGTAVNDKDVLAKTTTTALQAVSKASNADEALLALEQSLPNLGGFYLDETGTARILLTGKANAAERSNAAAIGNALAGQRASRFKDIAARRPTVVEEARFRFSELVSMRDRSVEVLNVPGVQTLDADERRNRVGVGVASAEAAERVREWWAKQGLPVEGLEVSVQEPVRLLTTLDDEVRPVPGGYKITNDNGSGCTIGYSVRHNDRNGEMGFITNSHCTNVQGGTENTEFDQPQSGFLDPNDIGIERMDPNYISTLSGCPSGKLCRHSDSAYANFKNSSWARLGRLAEPVSYCNNPTTHCTLTVNTSTEIPVGVMSGAPLIGQDFEKVGQTTGWTFGPIANTCFTVNQSGSSIALLCQYSVNAGVDSGDSGSPVFTWDGTTHPVGGLLWGSFSNSTFIFSHHSSIALDLGSLTYF
ncbi:hypothetical protein [Pyxidicoccus trucidator]|uniref:hypothetical protein n=1 Tax=Pyxidicoccus trucidator TaxID=2709662 RepID=UPI0013DA5278|nr:hypothetical protein [Pyxidicoccus trucidator]